MVFQDPERQLVMNKVHREVAFGLENLGINEEVAEEQSAEAPFTEAEWLHMCKYGGDVYGSCVSGGVDNCKDDGCVKACYFQQYAPINGNTGDTFNGLENCNADCEEERSNAQEKAEQEKEGFYEPEINAKTVEIVRNTIRSGQKEYYSGSVVIIGDINPGGEVEAGGDIIVFGKLRGIAHAGSNGDTSATITAIGLNPLQLRIAGIYRRSPDSESEPESVPEIARIKDGNIVIESIDKYKRGD
jgi:septum site-determining protein MinC